jgi:HlyD family secretion protein/Biotin-lipoyl like
MKIRRYRIFTLLPFIFLLAGCGGRQENGEKEIQARVPVTVENIHTADVADYLELNATSSFLVKSMIKSPTAGYVEEITVTQGDKVMKNQVLFKLRTKESTALQNDSLNPYSFSGLITLKANLDGIILSVDHPRGDYIQEGEQLAMIAVPSSYVYILDVPYESVSFIKLSSSCEISLPDGHTLKGRIYSRLPSITPGSQTQRYIIHPVETQNMPENLIAKVRILKRIIPNAVLLNKSCILADEVMQHFWVMKLVSDSVAVKIPVTTGLSSGNDIEITSPAFSPSDLFLSSGNYGLGDTVKVAVTKKISYK